MFVGLNEQSSIINLGKCRDISVKYSVINLNAGVKRDSFYPSFGFTTRPMNNQAQNKQFRSALRQACIIIGIPCDKEIQRKAHEFLHGLNAMGYKDMIKSFIAFFGT